MILLAKEGLYKTKSGHFIMIKKIRLPISHNPFLVEDIYFADIECKDIQLRLYYNTKGYVLAFFKGNVSHHVFLEYQKTTSIKQFKKYIPYYFDIEQIRKEFNLVCLTYSEALSIMESLQ